MQETQETLQRWKEDPTEKMIQKKYDQWNKKLIKRYKESGIRLPEYIAFTVKVNKDKVFLTFFFEFKKQLFVYEIPFELNDILETFEIKEVFHSTMNYPAMMLGRIADFIRMDEKDMIAETTLTSLGEFLGKK